MSDPLLLTVAETAAILHVSVDTIKRQIRLGLIPVKRIRTSVRVSREWIENYVAECAPILLTRRQVSVKLGIGKDALRSLLRKGLLPLVVIGKVQRIPASAVAEYLKRNQFAFLRSSGARMSSMPLPVASTCGTKFSRFSSVRGV